MSRIETFTQDWLRHRNILPELLNVTEEGKQDFRPWEGALSLGELVVHMVHSADWFVTAVKTGALEPTEKPVFSSVEDLKRIVREYTEKTTKTLAELSDDAFDQMVDASKVFGGPVPGKVLLYGAKDHEIHHKGQLFVYVRMTGAEKLPFFVQH